MTEKKIVYPSQQRINELQKYVKQVLSALGYEKAWVTDKSRIDDFFAPLLFKLSKEEYDKEVMRRCEIISNILGIIVTPKDYICELAQQLKNKEE